MKFSAVVVTYNPDLYKVLFTLETIIRQNFDDFEIVISDDGSAENHFKEIEAFFAEKQFKRYKLVANAINQGTVKNLISGLKQAEGKYVRDFGPGDGFYAEDTMQKIYDFMEATQYEACFGLIRGYHGKTDGNVEMKEYYHPFDIEAYRMQGGQQRILKNLVLYSDNVSGAATCYRREYYLEYLEKIQDYVVYEEDIFQVLAAMEGRGLHLFDDYMVWYEIGEGASTQKHSRFEELLRQDVERFYDRLYQQFGQHKYVKKRAQLSGFYKIKNLYLRTLLRVVVNPDAVRYLCSSMIQRRKGAHLPKTETRGFLDDSEFLKAI